MSIVKYLKVILSIFLSIFLTYYSVVMINSIEALSTIQLMVRSFIIFCIIYTCGKFIPTAIDKTIHMISKLAKFMMKDTSNAKPFN
jgi:hypothetical protein